MGGVLQLDGNLAHIAHRAAQETAHVCKVQTGLAPYIFVLTDGEGSISTPPMCIPAVLSYVLREVFKNACRAFVERHPDSDEDALPPVRCHIMHGKTGLLIKISDKGGGIRAADLANVGRFA